MATKEDPIADQIEKIATSDEEILFDSTTETTLTKAFDRRVIPWLFCIWLLAFIDRSNIGNARIDGLADDLALGNGDKFNIALTIFYVPYILVDVPSNWLVKRVGAGYYLPALVTGWGLVSLSIGFVKTYHGLLVARFFLGLMEGGLLGGIIIYLAMFYPRAQLMRRIGMFYCAAPMSGAIGGLLATGLSQINSGGYNGWPFIFFVEGSITVIFGIVAAFFLPDTPSRSKFLTEDQRYVAMERMKLDSIPDEKFSWHWVRLAILNWNTALLSLNFFAVITPIYSFSLFLPSIISELGFEKVKANLMTVPPNVVAVCTVLLATYLSDKFQKRGLLMLVGASTAIIGYIMLIVSARPLVQYGGTFFVAAGSFLCPPIVMGWLASNTAPHYTRATANGFQVGFANCAAFIATFTYIKTDAPRYITGHAINIGTLVLCLVITTVTMIYCKRENAKRERGDRDDRLTGDENLLGHRHPTFRYTL